MATVSIGINRKIMIKESTCEASLAKHCSIVIEGNSNNNTRAFSISSKTNLDI